ncbi:MAG: hypothetical protein ABF969_12935 [Sporolactobacillus sp.]
MYKETREYIFSEIGRRIKANKKKYGFTYYQLAGYKNKADYEALQRDSNHDSKEDKQLRYDKLDYSIITNIASGRAYSKKNPNLMSDTLLTHLAKKLKFSSELELLWGDFEKNDFPKILFEKLLLEVLYDKDESLKVKLNNILIDYVPYAEYHSYWQMFVVGEIEMPKLPNSRYTMSSYFYQIREDEIIEQYEGIQNKAIEFIYYKYNDSLSKLIRKFLKDSFKVNGKYSLKKVDNKLGILVSQLMDFFANNMPNEDSLGLRVRNIIISDYKKFGSLIAKELMGEQLELTELTQKFLVESSLTYITELKRVQVIELEAIKGYKFNGK